MWSYIGDGVCYTSYKISGILQEITKQHPVGWGGVDCSVGDNFNDGSIESR